MCQKLLCSLAHIHEKIKSLEWISLLIEEEGQSPIPSLRDFDGCKNCVFCWVKKFVYLEIPIVHERMNSGFIYYYCNENGQKVCEGC